MIDPKDANNLMIMMSSMCDQDDLIEMLQNAVDGYKNVPGQETWIRLSAICAMVMMKEVQLENGGDKDPMIASLKMMREMREFDDVVKLMKPNKQ